MAHLTKPQRYTIEAMLKEGHTQSEIARVIGKNKSVVSREIKRNRDLRSGSYSQDLAQRKYQKRQKEKPKRVRFTDAVKTEVETLLKEDYSPEQVVGTLKKGRERYRFHRDYLPVHLEEQETRRLAP